MATKKDPNKLKKLTEWQGHQYDPGYWTGGRLPPLPPHGKGSKRYGYLWLGSGVFLTVIALLFGLALVLNSHTAEEVIEGIPTFLFFLAFPALFFVVGSRFVRIGKQVERKERVARFSQRRRQRRKGQ